MFRTEFIAKIGFTRVLDRTCPNCGGLYSSYEQATCPKCNANLVMPAYNTDEGPKRYCLTELTLYPKLPERVKKLHLDRTKSAKGLLYTIRVVLWGHYDKERNVMEPDARTRYLVPKRTIRVALYDPPVPIPFTAKDGTQKLEMHYVFSDRSGDQIEFLDDKQEATEMMKSANQDQKVANTDNKVPTKVPTDVNNVQITPEMLTKVMAAIQQLGSVLPAPDPSEAKMTMTDADDYVSKNQSRPLTTDVGAIDPFGEM